jgi:hypothetical protein
MFKSLRVIVLALAMAVVALVAACSSSGASGPVPPATGDAVSADFRAGGSTQPRRDPGRGGRLGDVLLTWCVPAWVFLRGRSVSGFTVVRGPFCHVAINLPNHSSVSCYPAATGS